MQRSANQNKQNKLPPSQLMGFVKLRRSNTKSVTLSSTGTLTKTKVLPSITPKSSSEQNEPIQNGLTVTKPETQAKEPAVVAWTSNVGTRALATTADSRQPDMKENKDCVAEVVEAGPAPLQPASERELPERKDRVDMEKASASVTSPEDAKNHTNTDSLKLTAAGKPEKSMEEWQQEMKSRLENSTEVFNRTLGIPVKCPDGKLYSEEFKNHVFKVYFTYRSFRSLPLACKRKALEVAAVGLVSSGTLNVLCDAVIDIHRVGLVGEWVQGSVEEGGSSEKEKEAAVLNHQKVLLVGLATLRNYSDCSDPVTYALRDHPGFLEMVVDLVRKWSGPHLEKTLKKALHDGFQTCLSVIHNVSMREDNIGRFRELNTTSVLLPILKSHDEPAKLSAFASLADIVSEQEADMLATSPDMAKFLLNRLEKALKASDHRCNGWSVTELVRAVRRLGRNDANKRLLVDLEVLPLLAQGVRSDFEDEQIGCMEALWVLSFDDRNAEEIVRNEDLLDHVIHCAHDRDLSKSLRHSASGVLWQCRGHMEKSEKYKEISKTISVKKTQGKRKKGVNKSYQMPRVTSHLKVLDKAVEEEEEEEEEATGHIMLSYQWANQPVVKQIRDILRARGFRVWMDIDNMGGSTLQAMAAAVEDALVVLICMTQKYKDSPNTRAEAEYAFQQRKTIIPLIMERGYRPDGWLGMILGAKLFYDFSGKYSFESRIEGLIKEVTKAAGRVGGKEVTDGKSIPDTEDSSQNNEQAVTGGPGPAPDCRVDAGKVRAWKTEDVKGWLTQFGLHGTELERLTGKEIAFLHSLRAEAPEFFFRTLDKKLHITTLPGLMSFTEALDNLPTS